MYILQFNRTVILVQYYYFFNHIRFYFRRVVATRRNAPRVDWEQFPLHGNVGEICSTLPLRYVKEASSI